jgi:osmotically-inducible protein OsmY
MKTEMNLKDSRLKDDVLSELKWWPSVDAAHIGVTARDGVVTLSGQVAHYSERSGAEHAAKSVYGCMGIANDIEVEMLEAGKRSDTDIALAAVNALRWDIRIPPEKVKVYVKDGWVTLDGTVDWQFQKEAAERWVRYLMGVVSVSNNIAIKPVAKSIDVKNKIEEAFRRNADLEARRITVAAFDGAVTLAGSVATWSERDDAVAAAWAAPGVTSVDVELKVIP